MLFNLIGNSIKFTFNGQVKINILFDSNYLITEVEDTGIGMTEEDLTKLFRFFGKLPRSHKQNKGGMGFGLTISKMIVE